MDGGPGDPKFFVPAARPENFPLAVFLAAGGEKEGRVADQESTTGFVPRHVCVSVDGCGGRLPTGKGGLGFVGSFCPATAFCPLSANCHGCHGCAHLARGGGEVSGPPSSEEGGDFGTGRGCSYWATVSGGETRTLGRSVARALFLLLVCCLWGSALGVHAGGGGGEAFGRNDCDGVFTGTGTQGILDGQAGPVPQQHWNRESVNWTEGTLGLSSVLEQDGGWQDALAVGNAGAALHENGDARAAREPGLYLLRTCGALISGLIGMWTLVTVGGLLLGIVQQTAPRPAAWVQLKDRLRESGGQNTTQNDLDRRVTLETDNEEDEVHERYNDDLDSETGGDMQEMEDGPWQVWHDRRYEKLCIWPGRILLDTPALYDLCKRHDIGVISIRKIIERPVKRIRYDLIFRSEKLAAAHQQLQQLGREYGWWVRQHVPYNARVLRAVGEGRGVEKQYLKVATWNINGLMSAVKREELKCMANEAQWDIILLQETRIKADYSRILKLPGYTVMHCPEEATKARRGVAICVKQQLFSENVVVSDHLVVARVWSGKQSILVGSVYLPSTKGAAKAIGREAWLTVGAQIRSLRKRFPNVPMLVGGDFNKPGDMADRELAKWHSDLVRLPVKGSPLTWHTPLNAIRGHRQKRCWTAIDHILATQPHADGFSKVHVNRRANMSDHFAAACRVNIVALPRAVVAQQRTQMQLDNDKVAKRVDRIYGHNFFSVLAEEWSVEDGSADVELDGSTLSQEGMEGRMKQALDTINKVVGDLKLKKTPKTGTQGGIGNTLTEGSKKLIRKRRTEAARLANSASVSVQQRDNYTALEKEVKVQVRRDYQKKRWKLLKKLADDKSTNNSKSWWKILRACKLQVGPQSKAATSFFDTGGTLQFETAGIMRAAADHFGNLARDVTSHSRDLDFWLVERSFSHSGPKPSDQVLGDLNKDVSYEEVMMTLRGMKKNKAPGPSGVTADFLQAAVKFTKDPDNTCQLVATEMGTIIYRLVRDTIRSGYVCTQQRVALVIPLFKNKGSAADLDNYRGISLMDTILKLTCVLVNQRLRAAMEKTGTISKEQAGFRAGRDTSVQVVGLLEMCQRHVAAEHDTTVTFIDIKKAFDTVPHGALFAKLEAAGYGGMMVNFIKGLYESSEFAVALPCGVSASAHLSRGTRQGDPLSPLLFNLFINDLVAAIGPGSPVVFNGHGSMLYADDVAMVRLEPLTEESLARVDNWAAKNEMDFGVSSCGILALENLGSTREITQGTLADSSFQLQQQGIPAVDSYTYLGIEFNNELNVVRMAEMRTRAVHKALYAWQSFLTWRAVPVYFRVRCLSATIFGVARFGSELYGTQLVATEKTQRELSVGMRWCVGLKSTSNRCSAATLQLELGLPVMSAVALSVRVGLYWRWKNDGSSCLGELIRNHWRSSAKRSWVKDTMNWLDKKGPSSEEWLQECIRRKVKDRNGLSPEQVRTFILKWVHAKRIDKRATGKNASKTLVKYLEAKYVSTRGFINLLALIPGLATGCQLLIHARVGTYITGQWMAQARLISEEFYTRCPFCSTSAEDSLGPDTLKHMLLECAHWHDLRLKLLMPLLEGITVEVCDDDQVALILGGVAGSAHLRLAQWAGKDGCISQDDYDLLQHLSGELWKESVSPVGVIGVEAPRIFEGTIVDELAPCVRVAMFLQQVDKSRRELLFSLPKRADVRKDMAQPASSG